MSITQVLCLSSEKQHICSVCRLHGIMTTSSVIGQTPKLLDMVFFMALNKILLAKCAFLFSFCNSLIIEWE